MTVPLNVDVGRETLGGTVVEPSASRGVVVVTQGSGSSRYNPRNHMLARCLRNKGITTILVDLLCAREERADARTGHYRYQVGLLASRLARVLGEVHCGQGKEALPVGVLGTGRGSAVALVAAARHPELVGALISRDGRPDLAGDSLMSVLSPTLFISDAGDEHLLELTYNAATKLPVPNAVRVIPGTTSSFGEQCQLEQVAEQAGDWLCKYLEHHA